MPYPASILALPTGQGQVVMQTGDLGLVSYMTPSSLAQGGWASNWGLPSGQVWAAPAVAFDKLNGQTYVSAVVQDWALSILYPIYIPVFGTIPIAVQIAGANSVRSLVGMEIFPDGQFLTIAIGINGGLYAYSSNGLSANSPSALIPESGAVSPQQGGAAMAIQYLPAAAASSAAIYIVAGLGLADPTLQFFWTTYEFGSHAAVGSWQWSSAPMPTEIAGGITSGPSIAVNPVSGQLVAVAYQVYNKDAQALNYWAFTPNASPPSPPTQLGITPNSFRSRTQPSIAVDPAGSTHLILTAPPPPKVGTYPTVNDSVIPLNLSSQKEVNPICPVESPEFANQTMPAIAVSPNGEIDIAYWTNTGALLQMTLPSGSVAAWDPPAIIATGLPIFT
jgi:hypothetical protein